MSEQDLYWHEQIHSVMPKLEILGYEIHQEGLVNDVVIVNNEWVIRFAKSAWGKELMESESYLMRFIQPQLSLPIPEPVFLNNRNFAYRLLEGEPFLRNVWQKAQDAEKQKIADQLGSFLNELHYINVDNLDWSIPHSFAPSSLETWLEIHDRICTQIFPILLPHQIDWVEELFHPVLNEPNFFDFQAALIHGDLVPYHILCDREKPAITGIIDFGVAGLGDPAIDLGNLINYYGETLVSRIKNTYPDWEKIIKRARFYAQSIELQWVLLGVESGEQYWFASHLGTARDIPGY